MAEIMETLLLPLLRGDISAGRRIAVLNAQYHPLFQEKQGFEFLLQQHFRPYARTLQEQGLQVISDAAQVKGVYDAALVALPKDKDEARALTAQGIGLLHDGGMLVCAAGNKEGGTRIANMFAEFGIKNIQEESKNKARTCWGVKGQGNEAAVAAACADGKMQKILDGRFLSMPGIFGWDKIDKGSEILLKHLSSELEGAGADFGCGYGYLSYKILKKYPAVKSLLCVDADYRAVQACRENLKKFSNVNLRYLWEDLTNPGARIADLDWIVMNPPFHEGKKSDSDIGVAFIRTARESLRPGGVLYMVANAHLPYEKILNAEFSEYSKIYEGEGFKVFRAVR